LKRAGLIISEPKKKPKAAYICFAAEQPNQMWQVDFTHYRLSRADGTPGADVEILSFLDDHCRYAVSVTCHQPVTGPVVVTAFRQAVADQGIPASALSDNGMVFTTHFAGGHAGRDTINGFQTELRHLGVVQKHSRPNDPICGQSGAVPQTLKKWLVLQPQQPQTVAELQALCDSFVAYYNTQRPHRSLNRRTPSTLRLLGLSRSGRLWVGSDRAVTTSTSAVYRCLGRAGLIEPTNGGAAANTGNGGRGEPNGRFRHTRGANLGWSALDH
jgi:transposase InsO family protein